MINKKNREFNLDIKTVEEKIILAKNITGDATNFQNTVNVSIKVFIVDKFLKNIEIEKNFKYENIANKYDLGNYVRELKTNLAETIAEELVIKLSNTQ